MQILMLVFRFNILFFISLLFILVSCSKPEKRFTKDRYIVTSNTLNIRVDPTRLSKTIGTLAKGDTIVALASDKYWIMVKVDEQTGFISRDYIKKMEPVPIPSLMSAIEKNADWKVWQFWFISITLFLFWIFAELGLMRYENRLKRRFGVNSKRVSVSPLIFFVGGILMGVLYLYWRESVVESVLYNFSLLPKGMGSIAWIIWVQCLLVFIGLLVDFVGSLYRSGIKYGHVTFLMEQCINLIIFSTTFFLTISIFVAAIIFLIIFFSILYTIIVTENSKSFSGFVSGK